MQSGLKLKIQFNPNSSLLISLSRAIDRAVSPHASGINNTAINSLCSARVRLWRHGPSRFLSGYLCSDYPNI